MKYFLHLIPLLLLFSLSILVVVWDAPIVFLKDLLSGMNALSYTAYIAILVVAVVLMPLTAMLIISIATGIMGPLATALLSVVGWTLGAAIAFLISRYVGRSVVEKRIDLSKIDAYIEHMPSDSQFWFIVILRLTLPVDLVSYALGLTKSLSFTSYIAATALGVVWFSFAFAYLGDAFLNGKVYLFLEITLASLLIFAVAWYFLHSKKGDK
jgi:uncharacterized membrane protein YdjX (TVP38/TMEM64 family)